MSARSHQLVLRLLQALACSRIQFGCKRLSPKLWHYPDLSCDELWLRMTLYQERIDQLVKAMNVEERAQVRLERALFLRLLLESAPTRLQAWSDEDEVSDMPPSHLFEWVSHDDERLELSQLEAAMTPQESARYDIAVNGLQWLD
ncbi:hypothetical protein WKW77_23760 [Variovorax ureilyticus]|uniref:Uncharacterized protein n=1 Tax=Variovorax ureilyticus TaxID=1836198 RepID=A0ABU8VKD0_9BURK